MGTFQRMKGKISIPRLIEDKKQTLKAVVL